MAIYALLRTGAYVGFLAIPLISAEAVMAAQYPTKPIRIIVSSAPVGSNDIFARYAASKLTDELGEYVIVENRPGASGRIAVERAAKAQADGYTLLLGNLSTLAVNLSLFKSLPYDPIKDFQPIIEIAELPQVLVVNPSLPVKSVQELIEYAKKRPGQLYYGSGLSGSGAHLSAELLKWLAKVNIVMVPYKTGVGGALSELVGGQINMVFAGVAGAVPYISTGRLRPLGITGRKRVKALPTVPTIEESGVPGYQLTLWYGLLTQADTSKTIVTKLNGVLVRALNKPDVAEIFTRMGAEVAVGTPEAFGELIKAEIKKWHTVIEAAGIVPG